MKIKMHVLLGVVAVFVLALGANLNDNYANAEESGAAVTSSEVGGLSVSPSIDKLGYLEPGEVYEREIKVVNPGTETRKFKLLTSSFWVEDESYEVKWGVSESQYGKIANWTNIDTSKEHVVMGGETYRLKYTISVPDGQAGGAQRLMLTVVLGSPSGEGFIMTETHLNTLVYANVSGNVRPDAEVVSQSIQGFSFEPSVSAASAVRNTGDVDLDVTYRVRMTNAFGGDEVYAAEDVKILMTDSTRMFEQKWEGAPFLGIFNVTQQIELLDMVHEYTGVTIVCPLWLIVATVAGIAFLVIYIVYRRRKAPEQKS